MASLSMSCIVEQARRDDVKVSQLSGAMTNLVYRCRYQRGDEVRPLCASQALGNETCVCLLPASSARASQSHNLADMSLRRQYGGCSAFSPGRKWLPH